MRTAIILLTALLLLATATASFAGDHRTFGLGFVLGEPTGISAKYFLADPHALDFDLAFSFLDEYLLFGTDYLYHFNDVLPNASVVLMRPYIGGGGVVAFDFDTNNDKGIGHDHNNDFGLEARFTAGLSWLFTTVPLETFIDISPGIWLIPETNADFSGVIGLRYFF